jgi:geranyl-CoA carboxylase beta subunit
MAAIMSRIDTGSDAFAANRAGHLALIEQFRSLEDRVRQTSARARSKFEKRGQLLPRERIALLLDRGAPFIELSTLCGYRMHDDDGEENISGGGLIAGIGFVSGTRCMIVASDSGIKGGAATPMGVEKTLRAQAIAMAQKLPYVQLIESAGANLLRQADMFVKGGQIFANLSRLSAQGLPIVSLVNGSSTAGGAYQAGLSDYIIMVRGRSRVFLAGPPLLKAATGEIAQEEDLGGAEMHTQITGTGEYLAENDADGIRLVREVVAHLAWDRETLNLPPVTATQPLYDPEELLGLVPPDYRKPHDVREVVARLTDASEFLDFKPDFGRSTIAGHASICGHPVGIVSNNGPIDAQGAAKAGQFIHLCCQSGTPLVFLQNTTGFLVGRDAEEAGIVKHGSKMLQAVANASVPRITINIGASFGAGNYAMSGRGLSPDFLFSWPSARISVMGGEQAARTLTIVAEAAAEKRNATADQTQLASMTRKIIDAYEEQGSALYATARLWDDGLIDPRDTRRVLGFCLDTCRDANARVTRPNHFGVPRF